MWRSSLWRISWLRHQIFYPYVTISAAQAHESDDLHHAMSPFSLFLSSFSCAQRILGYVRPLRIVAVHPPKTGKRRSIWKSLQTGTDFTLRCDIIGFQMLLRRMQTWTETQHGYCEGLTVYTPAHAHTHTHTRMGENLLIHSYTTAVCQMIN